MKNLKYTHIREIKFDRTRDRDKSPNIICTHNYNNRYKCKDSARRINSFILPFSTDFDITNPKRRFAKTVPVLYDLISNISHG